MAVAWRVAAALAFMLLVAAIVYVLSHGRVFFVPFVLILGLPLFALLRRPSDRPPQ